MDYLLLVIGFVLLVKGADFFVDGSSSVAKILRVPSMIIGLTIVAMGTSAPEASVSITAALKGQNEIAMSNVVGSNIFNLIFIIGICACIKPMNIQKGILKVEYPFSIAAGLILLFFAADIFIRNSSVDIIGRIEGVVLVVLFVLFIAYMIYNAMTNRTEAEEEYKQMSLFKSIVWIIGGLVAIIIGGDLVVESACNIAANFGLSQTLIGVTIIACGTSLPELVTSVVAARKGEHDLALGNIVGSNIFNILFILGASAVISPVSVAAASILDLIILTVFSILVFFIAARKLKINRIEGSIMIIMYILYTVYVIYRG